MRKPGVERERPGAPVWLAGDAMPSNPFGVTLRMRVVGSPLLPVDPVRLRQALGNLSLEVADTGTGSGGRTPRGSRDTGGSGLGLAIVAQIARHDFFSPYATVCG